MKKAQGLSMNVIIVAALALIVLVVVTIIFTSNVRNANRGLNACESKGQGATCRPTCEPSEVSVGAADCKDRDEANNFCCLPVK
ncbi:hypothetical protein GOV04_02355 [Candidatus Woesearchaeota archaeon]|nr:hypothetical protein [Candidatus Woesearchaeota archaeon]